MGVIRVKLAIACGGMALICASAASAQNVDSLRKAFILPLPKTIEVAATASRSSPGSSSGSPSAYGADWGDGFIGAGYQNRMRYTKGEPRNQQVDGSVVAGFGLGNSRDYLGLELAVTSFSTLRSGFGNHDGISFKIHRVLPKNVGIAAGWDNAIITDGTDGGKSIYGAVSTVLKGSSPATPFFQTLTLTLGAGEGRFRKERDVISNRHVINPFASIGLRIIAPASVIADYTGQDLTLALSLVPFVRIPLVLTPGVADVMRTAGDGPRFTMGVGMGFRFAAIKDFLAPNR